MVDTYPEGRNPIMKGLANLIKSLFDPEKIPMTADFNQGEIEDLMKLKLIEDYFCKEYMTKDDQDRLLMEGDEKNRISKVDRLIREYGAFKIGKGRKGRKELIEGLKALFSDKTSIRDSIKKDRG